MNPKTFIENLLYGIFFYAGLFALLLLFLIFSGKLNLLSGNFLVNWDAEHYLFIKENGYKDFRVAFFPLFPLSWKAIGASTVVMTILNALLYIISFSFLTATFQLTEKKSFFLILAFPSLLFMFLPYSEAVFFLSASLLLIGLHKKNEWLIASGLILCGLARPVSYLFIPAIFITEFLCSTNTKEFLKKSVLYSLITVFGLFLAMAIQYYYTGNWFSFFEAQRQGWENYFRLPVLPLNSWGGDNILRLDASAFLVGTIAAIAVIIWIKKYFTNKIRMESKALVFSTLYLAGISMLILFFRGGWLFSLNRFVFATPFFMVAFLYFMKEFHFERRKFWWSILFVSAFWLLIGSYGHIQTFLKYEALTAYLSLFVLISHKNKFISRISFIICLSGNIFLFLYFYFRFMNGFWIA